MYSLHLKSLGWKWSEVSSLFFTSFTWLEVKCIHLNFSPLLSLGWKWSVFTSFFLYFFHLAKSEVNAFHFFSLGWKFTSEQVKEEWFHVHFHFFALHQKYTSSEVKLTFTLFTSLLVKSSQVCRPGSNVTTCTCTCIWIMNVPIWYLLWSDALLRTHKNSKKSRFIQYCSM